MSNSLRNIIIPKFYIYNTRNMKEIEKKLINFFLGGQCCIHLLKWYSPCFCFAVFRLSLMKRKTGYSAICFTVKGWVVLWSDQVSNSEMQNGESRNIHCKWTCLQEQAWDTHGTTETGSSPQGTGLGRKGYGRHRKAGLRRVVRAKFLLSRRLPIARNFTPGAFNCQANLLSTMIFYPTRSPTAPGKRERTFLQKPGSLTTMSFWARANVVYWGLVTACWVTCFII